MARMEKEQIVEDLKTLKVDFDEKAKYWDLYKLLKSVTNPDSSGDDEPAIKPRQIKLTNRIPKRRMFLGDAIRNERDTEFLNKEIGKREHKGKILRITTIKECEVIDGNWVTDFIIDLKE